MIFLELVLPFSMVFHDFPWACPTIFHGFPWFSLSLSYHFPWFSMIFPYFSHSNLHFSSHRRHLEACCKKAAASAPAAAERAARAAGSSWGGEKDFFSPWKSHVLDLGWGFDDDPLGSFKIFPDDLGWLKWRSGFIDELGCFRIYNNHFSGWSEDQDDELFQDLKSMSELSNYFCGVAVTCANLQIQHDLWWTLWFMRCITLFSWRAVYGSFFVLLRLYHEDLKGSMSVIQEETRRLQKILRIWRITMNYS